MYILLYIVSLLVVPILSAANNTTTTTAIPTTSLFNTTKIPTTVITTTNAENSTAPTMTTTSTIVCVKPCSCYVNKEGLVTLHCQISQLPDGWEIPRRFTSLDLSSNSLNGIPYDFFKKQKLSHLLSLSLQRNEIKSIEEDAFMGLDNLQWLDLSFVNLQEWRGNVSRSLPSLRYLDVTGNSPWLPTDNVLAVQSIRTIKGVSWSSDCFNCTLTHVIHMSVNGTTEGPGGPGEPGIPGGPGGSGPDGNFTEFQPNIQGNMTGPPGETPGIISGTPPGGPHPGGKTPMAGSENTAHMFLRKNYFPSCSEVPDVKLCFPYFKEFPSSSNLVLPSKLFYVAYALGALAIFLNFSIIFIYIYSTSMRKINSMLLISNMAFCDVLMGVYAIIIADMNIFNELVNRKTVEGKYIPNPIQFNRLCIVAGILFTLGQVVAVVTALLLTVDKFLSIVYCMDPNRKLSRRLSFLVLILCWVGAFLYALTPLFPSSSGIHYPTTMLCTLPIREIKDVVISFGLLVALYLANIPFYGKIFLFVRRSSIRMGVRRDAVLAKKIALLIFTNMVFFAVPMVIIIIFSFLFRIHDKIEIPIDSQDSKATTWRFIICYWMPVICLCFNSCLNPFLCAYRQRQFRREVKKCARNCFLNHLCKAFTTFRSDSSVRTTQPTRVEMYKLSNIESQAP